MSRTALRGVHEQKVDVPLAGVGADEVGCGSTVACQEPSSPADQSFAAVVGEEGVLVATGGRVGLVEHGAGRKDLPGEDKVSNWVPDTVDLDTASESGVKRRQS